MVSTDSVRHMMRGFISESENALLWASTYHAGEYLDQKVVSEAIHKKREKMLASLASSKPPTGAAADPTDLSNPSLTSEDRSAKLETAESLVGPKVMAIEGFKAQSEMVMDSVDRLITAWETKKESVVVEGVHLSINFVVSST